MNQAELQQAWLLLKEIGPSKKILPVHSKKELKKNWPPASGN